MNIKTKGVSQMEKKTLGKIICSVALAIGGLVLFNKMGKGKGGIEILQADDTEEFEFAEEAELDESI